MGFDETGKALDKLAYLETKELLEAVANPIENATKEAFQTETDPWGTPWVNQTSKTYNHLQSKFDPDPKKRDKGADMFGSLYSIVTGESARVGTNAVSEDGYLYPAVHQFGSKKSKGPGANIPKRAFLPIDENEELAPDVENEVDEVLDMFLEDLWK